MVLAGFHSCAATGSTETNTDKKASTNHAAFPNFFARFIGLPPF
jgi:hypothetical protein